MWFLELYATYSVACVQQIPKHDHQAQ